MNQASGLEGVNMRKHLLFLCFGWLMLYQLAAAETLLVAQEDADNRPFEYLAEDGHLIGFHTDIVRAVSKQLGWEVKFVRLPWKRVQAMLANGDVDAVTYMGKTPERQQYALFLEDNLLTVQHMALFVRLKDAKRIRYQPPVTAMMQAWRFGAPADYFLGEELDDALRSGVTVDRTARTTTQLLRMLVINRIDVAIGGIRSLQMSAPEEPALLRQIVRLEGARFDGSPVYIAFRNKGEGPRQASEFAAAYVNWRKGDAYRELVTHYEMWDWMPGDYRDRKRAGAGVAPEPARP